MNELESYQAVNPVKVIWDPQIFEEELFEIIDSAKKSICLSFYIFKDDTFGSRVMERLSRKAQEGVQVELLVDGFGSLDFLESGQKIKACKLRVYHPMPWPFSGRWFHWFEVGPRLLWFLWNINIRNHHKMVIVDERRAIIGSRNIHKETLEWHETSLVLTDRADLAQLQRIFDWTWNRSHSKFFKNLKQRLVPDVKVGFERLLTNHTRVLRKAKKKKIDSLMGTAKKRIIIVTPYFLPSKSDLRKMYGAKERGVSVEVLLPSLSDVPFTKKIAQYYYSQILKNNIRVFELNEKILHSKYMIIDDCVVVGSSNFNNRSRIRDLEIDYICNEKQTLRSFESGYQRDQSHSTEITRVPRLSLGDQIRVRMSLFFFRSWF